MIRLIFILYVLFVLLIDAITQIDISNLQILVAILLATISIHEKLEKNDK